MPDVTRLLDAAAAGDPKAAAGLLPLVYDELRALAAQKLASEKPGQTLQATALVHEAFLRLVASPGREPGEARFNGRGHFFATAAEAMRRIIIEQARRKGSQRRGGGRHRRPLDEMEVAAPEPIPDVLALNDALDRFQALDPAKAELVKLRYFVGLTIPQAAEALGISLTTAERYWSYARAWLHAELKKGDPDPAG
jgi:RNA polymerase sigma factor (TIGR02999 family)